MNIITEWAGHITEYEYHYRICMFHHIYIELKELVNIHGNQDNTDNEEPLSPDEVLIVKVTI